MKSLAAYQKSKSTGWSRVDMLLALYDATIKSLKSAVQNLEAGQADAAQRDIFFTQRCVTELMAGLDMRQGELPVRMLQLFSFIMERLIAAHPADLQASVNILTTLRDAFAEVREDALAMEAEGRIPPVDGLRTLDACA